MKTQPTVFPIPSHIHLETFMQHKLVIVLSSFTYFLQVRFVGPDDIWLSMNFKRQSCHLTVIIYNPSAELKNNFFSSLYEAIRSLGAKPRPHFGKYFNLTVEEMKDLYPKYVDFKQVRMRLDPNARFVNSLLADLFLF